MTILYPKKVGGPVSLERKWRKRKILDTKVFSPDVGIFSLFSIGRREFLNPPVAFRCRVPPEMPLALPGMGSKVKRSIDVNIIDAML
jgi:hypothetical protein|uniref:hypothetical protein n=1 Tax=Sulfobacillus thermotolerans TaxID=338644 RepID=UPI00155DAC72|nr:hypothetical protein [Sulfobacillus thermotolerans]